MSYATPEGKLVRKLLDYANALPGTTAHKVHGGQFSAGEPDLDIVAHGLAIKVEVKLPGTEHKIKSSVTPLQAAALRRYARAGAIVGVVVSVEELAVLLEFHVDGFCADPAAHEAMLARVRARLD